MFSSQLGTKSVLWLSNLVYLGSTQYDVHTDEGKVMLIIALLF